MKRKLSKLVAFFLVLCMAVPVFTGLADHLSAQAASASLNATSRKVYLGTTFQLKVENVDMSTVKSTTWKANRSSIAKVDSNGLVTPVKVGTTTVKCTLQYKDGTKKELACTIIVRKRVEATAVKFTNVTLDDNNAKSMYVGSTFTIKKSVTPSDTTDSVFYSSDDESVATVSTSGVVTAKKPGFTVIEVRYGLNKTEAVKEDNKAVAKFYLHVVEKPAPTPTPTPSPTPSPTPTPTPVLPKVDSANMVGSQELRITFNQPVRKSSVLSGSKLVAGAVVLGRDEKATDFGTLTAALSEDAKTLTIRGTGSFNGIYSVVVSDKVLSTAGVAFEQYAQIMTLKDTSGPSYQGSTVGYNGWLCEINFDETIDITNMTVENVSGTTDANLTNYLKNPDSYTLSEDGRSLRIDLSSYTTDKNLRVTVSLKGIRDTAGNATANQLQNVLVRTDASAKPIARIVSVERVSKSEIEATFSAELYTAGMVQFGSAIEYGYVDPENMKVAHYAIPAAYQSMTGNQAVTFQSWYNYNAQTSSATPMQTVVVNFTLDTAPPQIISSDMVNAVVEGRKVCKLILTYNKEISYASTLQQIGVRVRNTNGDISTATLFSTEALIEGTIVTYVFEDQEMFGSGQFTITLPVNMVTDRLGNYSREATISINKNGTASSELPAPIEATQDTTDLGTVYLTFSNKIDPDTAERLENYYLIEGSSRIYPVGASVNENKLGGAVVALTFNVGTFKGNYAHYELVVNGVRGYGGSFDAITNKSVVFAAIENEPPRYVVSTLSSNTIIITMSEEVMGTMRVTATDSSGAAYTGIGNAIGKQIFIYLDGIPISRTVRFSITENEIFDYNKNRANFATGQYVANAGAN